jgi:hypothetical protein
MGGSSILLLSLTADRGPNEWKSSKSDVASYSVTLLRCVWRGANRIAHGHAFTQWKWWSITAQVIVIGLLVDNHDRHLLANVSSGNGWTMYFVDSLAEAQGAAANLRVPVILCDRDLAGADWRETVSRLASSSLPTCVILISRAADDCLWEEVIRSGGYEVLSRPLRPEEVVRVVKLAWSFWNSMLTMPAYSGKRGA